MNSMVGYCTPFFVAAILIFVVSLFAYRRRRARGAGYLIFLCLSASIWAATEGFLYLGLDIKINTLITKLQYLGIAPLPPLALLFAISFFGFESLITRTRVLLLFFIAAAIIILVWTNPLHNLVFTDFYTIDTGPFPMLGLQHGHMWWVIVGYHYFLLAALSAILLFQVLTSAGFYRSQAGVLLSAVTIVWVVNGVYVSGHSPIPNMDMGPIAFTIVAGAMAWCFFRYSFLDILPIARAEIFRKLDNAILVLDAKNRVTDMNLAAESMFDINLNKNIGRDVGHVFANYPQLYKLTGEMQTTEACLLIAGHEGIYDIQVSAIKNRLGAVLGQVITLRDITEQKRVENVLRKSEERTRVTFNAISDAVFLHPLLQEGFAPFVDVNDTACKRYGYTREEILKLKAPDITKELDARAHSTRDHRQSLRDSKRLICESTHVTKSGEEFPVEINSAVIELNSRPMILAVVRDITERKVAEEKLTQSEEQYRTMVERSNDMIWTLDTLGNITFFNKQVEKVTGLELKEWGGKSFVPLIIEEDLPMVMEIFEKGLRGEDAQYELRFRKREDEMLTIAVNTAPLSVDGTVSGIVSFGRDITESKLAKEKKEKLEKQLRQAHKMESIGTLAGGIAHDFNNILSGIFGYTELLQMKLQTDPEMLVYLDSIVKAGYRAKELVEQILTFSRQSANERRPMHIQLVIKEALKLIKSLHPSTIFIHQRIQKDCGLVLADHTQIHQIIMNLCTNAYHAMEETGGEIIIDLREVELAAKDLKNKTMLPGKYVQLTVADTGTGMSQGVIDRIFDPYFTTKEEGKGTGLGLAVIHGIVKSHEGHIRVDSGPGKGTKFHVYLPVIEAFEEKTQVKTQPFQKGNEHVLLVDDQKDVVDIEQQLLEAIGYQVTSKTSGVDALDAFRANPDSFDLVITDMTMPNITGDRLARELKKTRPDIPVILCTGFSEAMSKEKAAALEINGFLLKPVMMKDLSREIRKVLDSKESTRQG